MLLISSIMFIIKEFKHNPINFLMMLFTFFGFVVANILHWYSALEFIINIKLFFKIVKRAVKNFLKNKIQLFFLTSLVLFSIFKIDIKVFYFLKSKDAIKLFELFLVFIKPIVNLLKNNISIEILIKLINFTIVLLFFPSLLLLEPIILAILAFFYRLSLLLNVKKVKKVFYTMFFSCLSGIVIGFIINIMFARISPFKLATQPYLLNGFFNFKVNMLFTPFKEIISKHPFSWFLSSIVDIESIVVKPTINFPSKTILTACSALIPFTFIYNYILVKLVFCSILITTIVAELLSGKSWVSGIILSILLGYKIALATYEEIYLNS